MHFNQDVTEKLKTPSYMKKNKEKESGESKLYSYTFFFKQTQNHPLS